MYQICSKRKWDLDDKGEKQACQEKTEDKRVATDKTPEPTDKMEKEGDAIEVAKEAASKINVLLENKLSNVGEGEETVAAAASLESVMSSLVGAPTSIASTLGLDFQDESKKEKDRAREKLYADSQFKSTVDINDHKHRYYLSCEQTVSQIEAYSGAVILVKGKYYPDRNLLDPLKDARPLYLEVSAPTQDSLDKALRRISELTESGPPTSQRSSTQPIIKVMAPFDAALVPGSFNFRAKILGPQVSLFDIADLRVGLLLATHSQ